MLTRPPLSRLEPALDAAGRHSFLRRRVLRAKGPADVSLRRRRRVAASLACITGAAGFFALYVLSWVVVLDL
ncbi:MAG: hypothetical protein U5Q16_16855 [Gammaproteobacteria bacterium]|nr:hypothetical protein [Gammaproteobacteria bacterium]